jgi:hypothetical protein
MGETEKMYKKVYNIPSESIEPEVERQLTVARIDPPGPFPGYIKPDQLEKFKNEPGIVDLLIGLGRLEEGQDWLIQQSINSNRQRRRIEAELIRLRKELADEKRMREEQERAAADKTKLDVWKLIMRVIPWLILAGLGLWIAGGRGPIGK